MTVDPYPTLKRSLISLREYVVPFNDEIVTTDKHDLWSTKKLIALRYYLRPYLQIMRNKGFKKIHYVDLFSGSGLLRIKNKIMPGTSLIPLLRTKELIKYNKTHFFDEYHISDSNTKYVQVLQDRVNKVARGLPTKIHVNKMDFASSVDKIFLGTPPKFGKAKDNAYLVVLDPYGFDIDWQHLQQILQSGSVDVFITFPTSNISWNQNKQQSESALNKMYGNDAWQKCNTVDDFVDLYCKKITSIPTTWLPFKTKPLTVPTKNGKYHLICASRSPGAENIFSDMQKRFNRVDNGLLEDVFNAAVKGQPDLDSFS